jgi:hypothetical protein
VAGFSSQRELSELATSHSMAASTAKGVKYHAYALQTVYVMTLFSSNATDYEDVTIYEQENFVAMRLMLIGISLIVEPSSQQ